MDGTVFDEPLVFSLAPFCGRPQERSFRSTCCSAPECPDRAASAGDVSVLALQVLKECIKAAGRLQGLRKVAGAGGGDAEVGRRSISVSTHDLSSCAPRLGALYSVGHQAVACA